MMFRFSKKDRERKAAREAKWNALAMPATIFHTAQ